MLKLSIIIPVYNVEKYLKACLDSVIYPGLEGYEIIIVNDGSNDSSPDIAASYAAAQPSLIRLVNKENGGLGHARNTGIAMAEGEYLLFLDSDDSLAQGAVREILQVLEQDFDICVFDFVSVNELGRTLRYNSGCEREGEFTLAEYPELLWQPPNACNKIWRRSLFTQTGIAFPDRMWYEDLATSPRLYTFAKKIISVRKPWYVYLIRSGSITNSANIQRNMEIITAVDTVLDYYRKQGIFEQYHNQLEYMAFYHQLLTASTRVNLLDRNSPVQDRLLEDYIGKFPDYRANPYLRSMSHKYKLLLFLIRHRLRLALNLTMRLNNTVRRKSS